MLWLTFCVQLVSHLRIPDRCLKNRASFFLLSLVKFHDIVTWEHSLFLCSYTTIWMCLCIIIREMICSSDYFHGKINNSIFARRRSYVVVTNTHTQEKKQTKNKNNNKALFAKRQKRVWEKESTDRRVKHESSIKFHFVFVSFAFCAFVLHNYLLLLLLCERELVRAEHTYNHQSSCA